MCIYFIAALSFLFIAKYLCTKIASFDYKRLRSWSKEVLLWLRSGKDVFGGAFVVVAFLAICWILGWNNKAFTALGCVLELGGMAQTTVGLLEVYQLIKKWIGEYPARNINGAVEANIDAAIGFIGSLSGGPGVIKDDPKKSSNERISNLFVNTNTLDMYIILHERRIENLAESIGGLKSIIKSEINRIKDDNKKELKQLLVGFAWIAAGTIMGAIGSLLP
ncbi:hypothetical protein [Candidatus Electronema sp. PJ]|uniref:hypothetical protein n=1 Tax=Candidatus Electronema sp. PJ TaxID=3401572 RepID=UPI003AA980EB